MRLREIPVSVFLGAALLSAFFLAVAAGLLFLQFALNVLVVVAARLFPAVVRPQGLVLAIVIVGCLFASGFKALRLGRLPEFFLILSAISVFMIDFVIDIRLGNPLSSFWILLPILGFGLEHTAKSASLR